MCTNLYGLMCHVNDADVCDKLKWLVNIHEVCGWPNMDSGMSYHNLVI